jgi:DNA invertase Pin-like site-specific DNA recombinase
MSVRRRAAEIIRLKEQGVTPTEIATRLGIGRASVDRVLAEQN